MVAVLTRIVILSSGKRRTLYLSFDKFGPHSVVFVQIDPGVSLAEKPSGGAGSLVMEGDECETGLLECARRSSLSNPRDVQPVEWQLYCMVHSGSQGFSATGAAALD